MKFQTPKKMTRSMYYIESEDGEKIVYDKNRKYFLEKTDVGFCLWNTKEQASLLIQLNNQTKQIKKKLIVKLLNI